MQDILIERFRTSVTLRLAALQMSRAEFCRRSEAAGHSCDQHWLHRMLKTDNLRIKDIHHMAKLLGLGDGGFFALLGLDLDAPELCEASPKALHKIINAPIPQHLIVKDK